MYIYVYIYIYILEWGNKREADWLNIGKEEYRQIDKNAVILEMLTTDNCNFFRTLIFV